MRDCAGQRPMKLAEARQERLRRLVAHDVAHLQAAPAVIGVDEVGRGALAGPVVAAAALVRPQLYDFLESVAAAELPPVDDSKRLSATQRQALVSWCEPLQQCGWLTVAIGEADVGEIACLNILGATQLAMRRAIATLLQDRQAGVRAAAPAKGLPAVDQLLEDAADALPRLAEALLVDGRPLPKLGVAHTAIVKGDGRSLAIALAAVHAKVYRDAGMCELAVRFPAYAWQDNMGYGTPAHLAGLRAHGPCPEHRSRFLRKLGFAAGGKKTASQGSLFPSSLMT